MNTWFAAWQEEMRRLTSVAGHLLPRPQAIAEPVSG